jgi:hypothetical protein
MPLRNPLELFGRNFGAKFLASAPLKNSHYALLLGPSNR